MKKLFFLCIGVLVSLGIFALPAHADLAGYTIDRYDVSMNLHSDGSMDVTEKIDVNFSESRHGIYRQIPIRNTNTNRIITIENLTAIGDPVASNTINGNYYELKIGSANTTLIGTHTYTIQYTVKNAIVPFGTQQVTGANYVVVTGGSSTILGTNRQEFYRNIIGGERATSIKNISFDITLPKNISFLSGQTFFYYGGYGAKNTYGASLIQTAPNKIEGSLTQVLQPKQGATVGLQFSSGFFSLPDNYEQYFYAPTSSSDIPPIANENTPGNTSLRGWLWKQIFNSIGGIFPIIVWILIIFGSIFSKGRLGGSSSDTTSAWKSDRTTTIYYTPPKNIEPLKAFYFWYNDRNPRIFSALIYYRATKGRARIDKTQSESMRGLLKNTEYTITEKQLKPENQTALESSTMQDFFGVYDNIIDSITLEQKSSVRSRIDNIFDKLENSCNKDNDLIISSGWFFRKHELTEQGNQLYEEMRGFKEYLQKVERPVIEAELKNDPDYINKILPWAVLFGVDTNLLKEIGDLLQQTAAGWYSSYDGLPLDILTFRSLNSAAAASMIIPQSSSSGGGFSGGGGGFSGFSGGGDFSGGGGGGGGGGSW